MGTKMNRGAFQRLVDENIEWLLEQPQSLERDHIAIILEVITDLQYPKKVSKWISTLERLPNDKIERFHGGPEGSWGCAVLSRTHDYGYDIVYFNGDDDKFWKAGKIITVDYWQYVDPRL